MHPLYTLLAHLDAARLHYHLARHRADNITVTITFVGERTEVDVFADGHMEVTRFLGAMAHAPLTAQGSEDISGGAELVWQLLTHHQKPSQT